MRLQAIGLCYVTAATIASVGAATATAGDTQGLWKRADAAGPGSGGGGDDWEPSQSRKTELEAKRTAACAKCATACMFNVAFRLDEADSWPRKCVAACSVVLVDAMEALAKPDRLRALDPDDPEQVTLKWITDAWVTVLTRQEVLWATDNFNCIAKDIPAQDLARFKQMVAHRRKLAHYANNADNNFELLQPGELESKGTNSPAPPTGNVWKSLVGELRKTGSTMINNIRPSAGRGGRMRVLGH